MTIRTLMLAIVIAALSFPLAAKAQDGIGPTNWANAGGSDPARDLVGLGVPFERVQTERFEMV